MAPRFYWAEEQGQAKKRQENGKEENWSKVIMRSRLLKRDWAIDTDGADPQIVKQRPIRWSCGRPSHDEVKALRTCSKNETLWNALYLLMRLNNWQFLAIFGNF